MSNSNNSNTQHLLHVSYYHISYTTRAFAYALLVFSLSTLGLALALANNLEGGTRENPFNIPVQIDTSVRIAQYVAIMVGACEYISSSIFFLFFAVVI